MQKNELPVRLYPDHGGDDLQKIVNREDEYLEINGTLIVPKRLIFEKVSESF